MRPEQGELHRLLGECTTTDFSTARIFQMCASGTYPGLPTLTREFSGNRVMAITHHLTILATRANFERLSPEEFLQLDEHEKPVNCSVTR